MQPQHTPGVVPVHHQIADAIRAQIADGTLKPGDSIPTVNDLTKRWNCAPGSARSALAVLRGEGLITSGRGRAATVRQPRKRTPIKLSAAWSQEQKDSALLPLPERGQTGAIELTAGVSINDTISTHHYSTIKASDELASEFGIEPGADVVQRAYEMIDPATSYRIAWSLSYIPHALIESNPDLLDETKEPWAGGHHHQLYTVGIEIGSFERSVIAVEPTPADRQRWDMDEGVPLLRVRSRSIDVDGRVVELSDAEYPADRTEITFTEKLRRWPRNHPKYDRRADGGA
jgi:GntR family transcriptional regulator